MNGVRHGGGNVQVLVRQVGTGIEAMISDSGQGFGSLRAGLPDSDATSGRGLFLIASLTDVLAVSCNDHTEVTLRKRLPVAA